MRIANLVWFATAMGLSPLAVRAEPAASRPREPAVAAGGMVFLHYADPRFLDGLRRHGMLRHYGLRLLNTGLDARPFGEKWADSPMLQYARSSGRPYYFDRLAGGMPFQSLEGLRELAATLNDDPNFLGFQLHEWGNSPIHDYRRIGELIAQQGGPFRRETLASIDRRIEPPHMSGGDYETYRDVYRPLSSLADVDGYLTAYFRHYADLTGSRVVGVNGFVQMYHKALELGASNVMAEIGNQVPLTALQIACVRGAARQYGKPFGVYYEPWGGRPFGCPCAVGWSPWCANTDVLKDSGAVAGFRVGRDLGSSRSLQRRLLYFAWLSGATYCAEEWGTENYFENWTEYPLTEYGRVVREFLDVSTRLPRPEPIVPAAIVMPPARLGIDVRLLAGEADRICGIAPADDFHRRLKTFAADVLGAQKRTSAGDAHNLTASPWIGAFDVLSDDASAALLSEYGLVMYMDAEQAARSPVPKSRTLVYEATADDSSRCVRTLTGLFPYRVEGQVGAAHARAGGRYLLCVFNNVGVSKIDGRETTDPRGARTAVVRGPIGHTDCLAGSSYLTRAEAGFVELQIPAGGLVILAFQGGVRWP